MTAQSKKRFRGHEEIILDGSRLRFEIWYRDLLLAKFRLPLCPSNLPSAV